MAFNKTEENIILAWLQGIPHVGSGTLQQWLQKFGIPSAVYKTLQQTPEEVLGHDGKHKSMQQLAAYEEYKANLTVEKLEEQLKQYGLGLCSIYDDIYPAQLREIYHYPQVLYYKGNINLLRTQVPSIGIVGARNCSVYGMNCARQIGRFLGEHGIPVVSGGARGIDAFAHEGILRGKGKGIVVMGCGLDRAYPRENKKLFTTILETGGLWLSEYSPGAKPLAGHFPARNRIISGLSRAIIVVEARHSSGSLITADFAISEGRDVYAVPGSIFSPLSEGSHWLLQQGAILLQSPVQILEDLGIEVENSSKNKKDSSHIQDSMLSFNVEENKILSILSFDKIVELETIITQAQMPLATIHKILLTLEMKHCIARMGAGGYVRV